MWSLCVCVIHKLFSLSILAKLVFKLDLSKYVYCTLEVYTGADIQPKSLYRFSSDIFTNVFFKKRAELSFPGKRFMNCYFVVQLAAYGKTLCKAWHSSI